LRSGTQFNHVDIDDFFRDEEEVHVEIFHMDEGARKHLDENQKWKPNSIQEALKHPNWKTATDNEVEMIMKMKTFHLVPPTDVPKGVPVHRPIAVYTRKFDGREKCRITFPGNHQRYGVDYFQTDSPTGHMAAFRLLLAKAQKFRTKIIHIDVKNAFLHGRVEEDVFMKQIPGYTDPKHPDWVCKLDGALYGLKQASRIFYQLVVKHASTFGLQRNPKEPCYFWKSYPDGTWMDLLVFVDDFSVTGDDVRIGEFIKFISSKLETKVMGELKRYIGVNVTRTPDGKFHLDQKEDIMDALKRFGLDQAKPASSPFDPSWTEIDVASPPVNQSEYRSAIGSLFWFAMATRPDILASVVIASQFQSNPTKQCWTAVKRIFRYLLGTINLPLIIDVGENFVLQSFSDSSHGDPLLSRYSMTGSMHFVGNAPILWLSRKQRTPALSSAEAELIAASTTARDTMWLYHFLKVMNVRGTPELHVDNQAAIYIAKSEGLIRRVKHLEIHDLYIRHLCSSQQLSVHYVPSEENPADIYTKGIKTVAQFIYLRDFIMAGKRGRDRLHGQ
jgi:hypothetical protein